MYKVLMVVRVPKSYDFGFAVRAMRRRTLPPVGAPGGAACPTSGTARYGGTAAAAPACIGADH